MHRPRTAAFALSALISALAPEAGLGAEPSAVPAPAAAAAAVPALPAEPAVAVPTVPAPTIPAAPAVAAPEAPALAVPAAPAVAVPPAPAIADPAVPAVAVPPAPAVAIPTTPAVADPAAPAAAVPVAPATAASAAPALAAPAGDPAAPPKTAGAPAAIASSTAEAPPERKPWRTLPLIGLSLVPVGFPDLPSANLIVRPLNWLRLYGGASYAYLSWGMQGGVVLAPINWYITPTLSLQAGKLFPIDASRFAKDQKNAEDMKPLLQRIDYRYFAGDLGLEFGSPRGFSLFLRAGLSFLSIKANGTGTIKNDDGTRLTIRDPKVSAWLPSAKFGFQFWF